MTEIVSLLHTQTFNGLWTGLPGQAGTRRNTHPLTPILIIGHQLPPFTMIHSILLVQLTC